MNIPDDATGRALKKFVELGSDLSKPMEIDFFVAVPSEDAGNQIALEVEERGFTASVEYDSETFSWTCYCTKILIPDYSEIVEAELFLDSIARLRGGYADGFGSYGNSE